MWMWHSSAVRSMEPNTDLYSPIVIRQGIVAKVPTNPRSRHADKGTGKHQGLMLRGADVGDLLLAGKQTLQNCRQREGFGVMARDKGNKDSELTWILHDYAVGYDFGEISIDLAVINSAGSLIGWQPECAVLEDEELALSNCQMFDLLIVAKPGAIDGNAI